MADDVSAPFPDIDWPDQAIIAVNAGDAAAKITSVVIHLSQDVPEDLVPDDPYIPLFVYGGKT